MDATFNPLAPRSRIRACRTPQIHVQKYDRQVVQGIEDELQGVKSRMNALKRNRSSAAELEGGGSSRLPKVCRGSKGSPFRARHEKRGPWSSPPSALDSDHNDSCPGECSSSDDGATRREGKGRGSSGYRDAHHHHRRLSAPARGGGAIEQGYYPYVAPPGAYPFAAPPPLGYYHYGGGPPPQGAAPGYPSVYPGLLYGQGRGPRGGGGGGGGIERGAVEWEGGAPHRIERRRRLSGSQHSQRDHRSSDDGEGGEGSSPRDARRDGDDSSGGELKGDGGNVDDVNAEEAAGAGPRAGPPDPVVSEDAAAAAAAEVAERNNADDGAENDGRRSPAAGQQKGVSSRVRSGRGGEKRSRRRDGSGDGGRVAGGGGLRGARRHSDGGRYPHDSRGYHASGVAQQAGFGYPMGAPGGVVDPRFVPPTGPIGHGGYPPASFPYVMHPLSVHHEHYGEAAGWAAGGANHPYHTPAHPPSHHRLPPYEGGNASRRRRTRSPAPEPVGEEKGVVASGGGAERDGGSRSRSGSWDSEQMAA